MKFYAYTTASHVAARRAGGLGLAQGTVSKHLNRTRRLTWPLPPLDDDVGSRTACTLRTGSMRLRKYGGISGAL